MGQQPKIIPGNDLSIFFREEVIDARKLLNIQFPELIEFYLVNLLCEYSTGQKTRVPGDEPLALLYQKALEADLPNRIQLLKELGDFTLYVAGFFVDFIERSFVSRDYYITMGGSAYSNLSGIVGNQNHGLVFVELYDQLGRQFSDLVELLNTISDRLRTQQEAEGDLVALYERWLRDGNKRVQQLLLEKGLITAIGFTKDGKH